MSKKIERNYLEINSLKDLNESNSFLNEYSVQLVKSTDFQLNKFFYKNIGKKYHWVDRLVWTEKQWSMYTSDTKVKTYVLKNKENFVGYFEVHCNKTIFLFLFLTNLIISLISLS